MAGQSNPQTIDLGSSPIRWLALGVAVIAVGTLACQTKPKPAPEPTPPEFAEEDVAPPSSRQTAALEAVYFDFDRADIRSDQRPKLRTNADEMKSQNWNTITLEGNCDERGSEEYNLALGDRRAMSVKRYLVDLGIPSSRLETVSFGEAKPAVPGHDESAWRYNRRVDFSVGR
jgi:peptidoglycan-associated lipoprotein